MKLPKSLVNGYNSLRRSRAVVKKDNDEKALTYFQNFLNNSQPQGNEEKVLHRFVRGLYYENKRKFLFFIRYTSFECLVLWTETRAIMKFLGVEGIINIRWQNESRTFQVMEFQNKRELEHPCSATELKLPSAGEKWADVSSDDDSEKKT